MATQACRQRNARRPRAPDAGAGRASRCTHRNRDRHTPQARGGGTPPGHPQRAPTPQRRLHTRQIRGRHTAEMPGIPAAAPAGRRGRSREQEIARRCNTAGKAEHCPAAAALTGPQALCPCTARPAARGPCQLTPTLCAPCSAHLCHHLVPRVVLVARGAHEGRRTVPGRRALAERRVDVGGRALKGRLQAVDGPGAPCHGQQASCASKQGWRWRAQADQRGAPENQVSTTVSYCTRLVSIKHVPKPDPGVWLGRDDALQGSRVRGARGVGRDGAAGGHGGRVLLW